MYISEIFRDGNDNDDDCYRVSVLDQLAFAQTFGQKIYLNFHFMDRIETLLFTLVDVCIFGFSPFFSELFWVAVGVAVALTPDSRKNILVHSIK